MNIPRILSTLALSITLLFVLSTAAKAQSTNAVGNLTYNITLSGFSAFEATNNPLSLDIQLLTGSGNVSNSVTLSSFVFTGGTSLGSNFTSGSFTGSFSNILTLSSLIGAGNPDNEYAEAFSSGVSSISFQVSETANSETVNSGTITPDQFSVYLYDSNGNVVPTTDPFGGNTLITESIDSTQTTNSVQQYSVAAVPEPAPVAFGLLSIAFLGGMAWLRRRQAA